MIIEGNRPKGNHELEDGESSLETPLQYEQKPIEEQVCLLRDSPFRILRVSDSIIGFILSFLYFTSTI